MIVGAGSMGALAGATLQRLAAGAELDVVVLNRSTERAERLAASLGGRAGALDALAAEIAEADVLISSTGATGLVVEASDVRSPGRPSAGGAGPGAAARRGPGRGADGRRALRGPGGAAQLRGDGQRRRDRGRRDDRGRRAARLPDPSAGAGGRPDRHRAAGPGGAGGGRRTAPVGQQAARPGPDGPGRAGQRGPARGGQGAARADRPGQGTGGHPGGQLLRRGAARAVRPGPEPAGLGHRGQPRRPGRASGRRLARGRCADVGHPNHPDRYPGEPAGPHPDPAGRRGARPVEPGRRAGDRAGEHRGRSFGGAAGPDRRHRGVRLGAAGRAAGATDRRRGALLQGPADRGGWPVSRWPRCPAGRIRGTRCAPGTG